MDSENKSFFKTTLGITTIILLVLCCCCLIVFSGIFGGLAYYNNRPNTSVPSQPTLAGLETPTETSAQPLENPTAASAAPTLPAVTPAPLDPAALDNLKTLEQSDAPVVDPYDLICRLKGKCNLPNTQPSGPYNNGDHLNFWVNNQDTAENTKVAATLQYSTAHAYLWVEDGVTFDKTEAQSLIDTFENKIYPTDRAFFGSEWTPGVDNDPHIYIVYARGLGSHVAGYFSSMDEYTSQAHPYSNAHEMFLFDPDKAPLGDPFTYGVLAHEFQHMIHWKQDLNETSWINEGFSDLAAVLNGYNIGGADQVFAANPDLQLTDWSPVSSENPPHYGASFLFLDYFLDRFGKEATQSLVKDQLNGMDSVDDTLKNINATDKTSGKAITADDLFVDWTLTNYLQNGSVGDGRYVYHNYPNAPKLADTQVISNCATPLNGTVHQYGAVYLHFNCPGQHTLTFQGATQTNLLPTDAASGKYAFWSNKGDESDMTLTRDFDFTGATGSLTLKYNVWYDLEKNYDYAFLEASTDGKNWQILKTPSGTDQNPSGNSYGWGYNGKSDGWLAETVDLSQFKGQKVQIRFEYVTDPAVNGEGLLLDDISVPEINYATDFEKDDGGWVGKGFVRVENALPQTFRLELISLHSGTNLQPLEVTSDGSGQVNIDLTDTILVVSGTTRFTRSPAQYTITVK